MYIDYLNLIVVLKMLAQLGDVHVHRTGVEVVVVNPDGLQGEVALQNLVGVAAEQGEQLVLLSGELSLLVANTEQLLLGVESEAADVVDRTLLGLLATYATQDGLNTEYKLLHRERLGDVVVGTNLESFEDVLFQSLGCEEYDRYLGVGLTYFLGECESVFLGHHHVENTYIKLCLHEGAVAGFAVWAQFGCIALGLQVFT